ncbi:MAG: hypothetical protein V8R84_00520 [Eubacterium sp.]
MAENGIGNGYFYPVKNQETVGMKGIGIPNHRLGRWLIMVV